MTWESLIKSLNSPIGKRLDRMAKQAVKGKVLSIVVPCVVPF
jgi:hypothetical protein